MDRTMRLDPLKLAQDRADEVVWRTTTILREYGDVLDDEYAAAIKHLLARVMFVARIGGADEIKAAICELENFGAAH